MLREERQTPPTSLFTPPLIVYIDHRPTGSQTHARKKGKKRRTEPTIPSLRASKSLFVFFFFLFRVVKGAGAE